MWLHEILDFFLFLDWSKYPSSAFLRGPEDYILMCAENTNEDVHGENKDENEDFKEEKMEKNEDRQDSVPIKERTPH